MHSACALLLLGTARVLAWDVTVVSQAVAPLLIYTNGSSAFEFAYNPAFVPAPLGGGGGGGGGLLVRVQRSPGASAAKCVNNRAPTSNSSFAFAPAATGGGVRRVRCRRQQDRVRRAGSARRAAAQRNLRHDRFSKVKGKGKQVKRKARITNYLPMTI